MMGMVGTPGLEPGRPIKPTDFKSVVFTNFTMPPKKATGWQYHWDLFYNAIAMRVKR
jgi:hypothetical protein